LQALDVIESGKTADESWVASQKPLFEQVRRPPAEVLIMIAPSINHLVQAAATNR
jgi:hypothetical protein